MDDPEEGPHRRCDTQVALQTRKLRVPYGNGRDAPNDDLVLALSIATYVATRPQKRTGMTHVGTEPPLSAPSRFELHGVITHDSFR